MSFQRPKNTFDIVQQKTIADADLEQIARLLKISEAVIADVKAGKKIMTGKIYITSAPPEVPSAGAAGPAPANRRRRRRSPQSDAQ